MILLNDAMSSRCRPLAMPTLSLPVSRPSWVVISGKYLRGVVAYSKHLRWLLHQVGTCVGCCFWYLPALRFQTIADKHNRFRTYCLASTGVPVPNGKQHVIEIALLALDFRGNLNKLEIPHMSGVNYNLRIGMATGECIACLRGKRGQFMTVDKLKSYAGSVASNYCCYYNYYYNQHL